LKVALGTVQFGVNYGISNKAGKTPQAEVGAILAAARSKGVSVIDTAALYGDSEAVLGQSLLPDSDFKIVTKTPQFAKQALDESDAQHLEDTLRASLMRLGISSVYGLLIHRADDLLLPGGDLLVERLLRLKQNGLVSKVGVSVYSGRQIDQVLERFPLDLIQLPINVLDQRLLQSGHLQKLKNSGVEIHARSAFLQGLLLMEQQEIPDCFDSARERLESYHQFIREHGLTPLQAALGFVSGIPEIDQVVCGVNNARQLHEICEAAQAKVDVSAFADFATADETIVNPALWQLDKEKK
jgi:aryl-alcohol dehydrogenase-like predicted oxidoreductase